MASYNWKGRTRSGESRSGVIEAASTGAVAAQLHHMGIIGVRVKPKPKDISEYLPFLKPRVSNKDLVVFTRQFAVMIDGGLPLVAALGIIAEQQENSTFQKVLRSVKVEVEEGATFAQALAKHPKVFDDLYVNLVAAGEVGGILDTILNRLASQLEKSEKLARQLRGAMAYPATVSVTAIGVILLLLVKVIPIFEKMFVDFGGSLPGPTQMVIDLSAFLQAWILYILAGITLFVVCFQQAYSRVEGFHFWTDRVLLRLPIFGNVIKKVAVARFTRTLGTMVASGVPILDGLDIVSKTAGNVVIEREIQKARQSISEGRTISEPLKNSQVFPSMMVEMIAVGEETGAMEVMLSKVADFYDDEVDVAVAALTSMLEPVMLVVMGGTVGAILIAMYLPIFTIAETIN